MPETNRLSVEDTTGETIESPPAGTAAPTTSTITPATETTTTVAGMPESIAVELVKLVPSFLWFTFVVVLFFLFYKQLKYELIPKLTGIKMFGVEATFIQEELNKAIQKQNAKVSQQENTQVLRRAELASKAIMGMRVLWVDDCLENIIHETQLFRSLGIVVDQVESTEAAMSMLTNVSYDAVISDIYRGKEPDAGIKFLHTLHDRKFSYPVILYVGTLELSKGVPPYAFGITNRPDYLLHYVIDIAERKRL